MPARKATLFVLSSPSGGGKSTVIQSLRSRNTTFNYSVSMTTRPPRKGEQEGREYFFTDEKHFQEKVSRNEFLEWAVVHGFYYGTLLNQVNHHFQTGGKILLDVDVQGGLKIKSIIPESVIIFLLPPSMDILEQRLRNRKTDNDETVRSRLAKAIEELEFADCYDFQIVNYQLNETVEEIESLINNIQVINNKGM